MPGGVGLRCGAPAGRAELSRERDHLHDLDLVHAQGILEAESGEVPVHQTQLELRIWQGTGGGDPEGRRASTRAGGREPRAGGIELAIEVAECQLVGRIPGRKRTRLAAEQQPGGEETQNMPRESHSVPYGRLANSVASFSRCCGVRRAAVLSNAC